MEERKRERDKKKRIGNGERERERRDSPRRCNITRCADDGIGEEKEAKPRAARGNRGCAVEGFVSEPGFEPRGHHFQRNRERGARERAGTGFRRIRRRYSNCFPV